ncbi:hypothetical protein PHET_10041 [Paragonimus heterotremus]|uniref:Asteroid domain-containing protein n=1 Tax=Paragonimus heterotremus TaxID=100268 RepID=A0A8J4SGE5_9TREM|nr:hypothetical protein PHET_10041 [Paragonimus heterotremus]
MPIAGLLTILSGDCKNFEPIQMHDTEVVINASDFMGYFYAHLPSIYGGEYLSYHLTLKKTFEAFDKCNIKPYFVFSGGSENRGHQLQSKLQWVVKRPHQLVDDTNKSNHRHTPIPPSTRSSFCETLRAYGHCFTVVPYACIRETLALATLLKCPVLGMSSDYFMMVSSDQLSGNQNYQIPPFVPLLHLNVTPLSDLSKGMKPHFILAHAFRVAHSEIRGVAPRHRPILALLMGSDTMPRSRLPSGLRVQHDEESAQSPKERRWRTVRDWLASFPPDSDEPVAQWIAGYPAEDQPRFIQQLADCLPAYIFDPAKDGSRVATQLQISQHVPDLECLDTDHNLIDPLDDGLFRQKDVLDILHNRSVSARSDFTVGWPDRLVRAYQKGKLNSKILCTLYNHGMPSSVEFGSTVDVPVCDLSLPIRLIHYRCLFGLELQLGGCAKLKGLAPNVTEYARQGDRMMEYSIPVIPLHFNMENEQTDSLISRFLGTTLPCYAPEPEWAYSLAVSIAFLHTQLSSSGVDSSPLIECPFTLALIACAVASMNELDSVDTELSAHYDKLADSLVCDLDSTTQVPNNSENNYLDTNIQRPDFVRNFSAIQLIYNTLQSFVNFMDSILPHTHQSELFHFFPPWNLFPSGRLVYWLAMNLATHEASVRHRITSRFWLPRLYKSKKSSIECAAELRELVSTFETVLKTASSLKLSVQPVKYSLKEIHTPTPNHTQAKPTNRTSSSLSYFNECILDRNESANCAKLIVKDTNAFKSDINLNEATSDWKRVPPNVNDSTDIDHCTDGWYRTIPTALKRSGFPRRSTSGPARSRGFRQRNTSGYSSRLLQRLGVNQQL